MHFPKMPFGLSLSMMFNTARMENMKEAVKEVKEVKKRKPSLDLLPNDILVDLVFNYLNIQDVLAMRRVSKLYHHLTKQPVIWKRFLKRTTLLLPPLPPEADHDLGNLKGDQAERFFMRAYEVDKAWREAHEQSPSAVWDFDAKGYVGEMFLLPGGRYLLASVSDRDKWRWFLVLYAIRDRGPAEPLIAYKTESRAQMLQAKFTAYKGVRGITVSWMMRKWQHEDQERHWGVNISDLGVVWEKDPPFPMQCEVRMCHIDLDVLEKAWDPRMSAADWRSFANEARLFYKLPTFHTKEKISQVCVDTAFGQPLLAVAAGNDNIRIKAAGYPWVNMRLKSHPTHGLYRHRIKAIRPLPQQRQILVVRVIDTGRVNRLQPCPDIMIELFDVPFHASSVDEIKVDAAPRSFCEVKLPYEPENVHITDPCTANWPDAEVRGKPWLCDQHGELQPINIFFVMDSGGVSRVTLFSKKTSFEPPLDPTVHWRYDLGHRTPLRREYLPSELGRWAVIPGSRRSWFYSTHWKREWRDWVDATYRYHDPEIIAPEDREEPLLPHPPQEWLNISGLKEIKFELGDTGTRFESIAFDEMTGRMMFAKPDHMEVTVLDLSREINQERLADPHPLGPKLTPRLKFLLGLGSTLVSQIQYKIPFLTEL